MYFWISAKVILRRGELVIAMVIKATYEYGGFPSGGLERFRFFVEEPEDSVGEGSVGISESASSFFCCCFSLASLTAPFESSMLIVVFFFSPADLVLIKFYQVVCLVRKLLYQ